MKNIDKTHCLRGHEYTADNTEIRKTGGRYCRQCRTARRLGVLPKVLPLSDEALFWAKVDKAPGFGPKGECWRWTAALQEGGYGKMQFAGKTDLAHRISFRLAYGEIPSGALVRHSCDNPACVNPAHLSIGSALDNAQDALSRNRNHNQKKTHCMHGHEFDEANTRWHGGHRQCIRCQKHRDKTARLR